MPLSTPQAQFADHLLKGRLSERLAGWRAEGKSWDDVARSLWVATGQKVSITGPTAQSWAEQLDITSDPTPAAEAAS